MKKLFFLIFFLAALQGFAQKCPDGFALQWFYPSTKVSLAACVEGKPGILGQQVFWGAKNLTHDKLYISFVKVIYTTCGKTLREKADTYLDPDEFKGSGSFSGEITFSHSVQAEDCGGTGNRISRVT
ncbi:MAG: hypothetical protein ABW019_06040, partial [Chitinophagaceae bacterium]